MINRIERPLANDHPDGSFSVHLFLHRPKTQNSRIIGQYVNNSLGLKPYPSQFFFLSIKIWIKGPQIGSDMPSALGLVRSRAGTSRLQQSLSPLPFEVWQVYHRAVPAWAPCTSETSSQNVGLHPPVTNFGQSRASHPIHTLPQQTGGAGRGFGWPSLCFEVTAAQDGVISQNGNRYEK